MKNLSFYDQEAYCQNLFDRKGPFWHIATLGDSTSILFTNPDDYRFGMSLFAVCAWECNLKVYAFQIMSNHLHNIAGASEEQCCYDFLESYSHRLMRYASNKGYELDLSTFVASPIEIDSLQSLRNNIVYTHRNAYVIDVSQTPFSCPWGSGPLYFGCDINEFASRKFNDLPYREKRMILNGRVKDLPDTFVVRNSCIAPESICDWRTGRNFFRDAHQYFNLLGRNFEAYAEFASLLKDKTFMTDAEMYSAACVVAKQQYNISVPSLLPSEAKLEMARKLHFDYRAGNNQIRRILKIDIDTVNAMFPSAR